MTGIEPLKDVHQLVKVSFSNTQSLEVKQGTTALELLAQSNSLPTASVVAVRINNRVCDLRTPVDQDSKLEFITMVEEEGMKVYRRSLVLLLMRAAYEVMPGCGVTVEHTLGNGLYGEIRYKRPLDEAAVKTIEQKMREIAEADQPIEVNRMDMEQIEKLFMEIGQVEKVALVKNMNVQELDIYSCGCYHDYLDGPTVPGTGYLKTFRLQFYLPGFILEFPRRKNPREVPPYIEQGKLANIYFEKPQWTGLIGVNDLTCLNQIITAGDYDNLIQVSEAFQEKKIIEVADRIAQNIDRVRIVLMAGPSSSGKTTSAQRLAVQLQVNGIRPVAISMDNYFVDREYTPRDENGEYDFESINAIDCQLFNEHLVKLIQGEEVELPYFNFHTGKKEYHGERLKLGPADMIIVEGIHALNDNLTRSVPKGRKFKIYVSALTHLNIDNHHRIATTDLRLIRRIVRDNRTRSRMAWETIKMWPSVRRGEERHIFPFQESADILLNSALPYELSVLKKYAVPLLSEINDSYQEYSEARRLLWMLGFFKDMDDRFVPNNSIMREFIGGSCFANAR